MKWRVKAPDGSMMSVEGDSQEDAIRRAKAQRNLSVPTGTEPPPMTRPGFPEAPPGPTGLRAPTFWEKAKSKVGEVAGPIPEYFTPSSWTGAGIEGALAASPFAGKAVGAIAPRIAAESPALARMLTRWARIGLSAAGGALGGGLGGEGAGQGARRGAEVAGTGEVLATPVQWLTRSLAGPIMQRLDSQRLSKVAGEIAPALQGQGGNPAQLHKLVMGTAGEELLGQALETELKPVMASMQGLTFHYPTLDLLKGQGKPHPVTFEQALEEMRKIGYRGYSMTGDPRGAASAIENRQLRRQLREEITQSLTDPTNFLLNIGGRFKATPDPKRAEVFNAAMQRYSRGREVVDILAEPSVWENGRLNMRALQEMTSTEEYKSLGRTLKNDVQKFYNAVFRGGSALTRDVPGSVGLHLRLYPGVGMPHAGISMPRFPSYEGPQAPGIAKKGASFAPAASFAALGLVGKPEDEPPPMVKPR